jgi:hypothetical protein
VDPRGIEPLLPDCQPGVLPLDYGPGEKIQKLKFKNQKFKLKLKSLEFNHF